jgi:uncharacterized membrane protein
MRALAIIASVALLSSACLIERQQIDRPKKSAPKPVVKKKPEPPPAPPLTAASLFAEHPALQCMGNEPAWAVIVDEGGAAYRDAENPDPRAWPAPTLADQDGAVTLSLADGDERFSLSIKRVACQDSMSDESFPLTASYARGEATHPGCCRAPIKAATPVLQRYPALTCDTEGFSLELTPTSAKLGDVDLGTPSGLFEAGRLKVTAGDVTAQLVERACGEGGAFSFRATQAGKSFAGCCAAPATAPTPAPPAPRKEAPAPAPKPAAEKTPPKLPDLKRKLPAVTPKLPTNLKVKAPNPGTPKSP